MSWANLFLAKNNNPTNWSLFYIYIILKHYYFVDQKILPHWCPLCALDYNTHNSWGWMMKTSPEAHQFKKHLDTMFYDFKTYVQILILPDTKCMLQGPLTSISIRPMPMTSYLTTIGMGSVLPARESDLSVEWIGQNDYPLVSRFVHIGLGLVRDLAFGVQRPESYRESNTSHSHSLQS